MKKLIVILLFLASAKLFAQDTTKVLNVSLQARIIEYLAPSMINPEDVDRFNVFLKWRTLLRASKATGNTNVVTDTIPTTLLAELYGSLLAEAEGMGIAALMKTQITGKRASNKYLNTLCTAYEQRWVSVFADRRARGRKLLLGQ